MTSSIVIIDDCELIKFSLLKILPDYSGAIRFYCNLSDALKELKIVREREKYIFILDLELVTHNGISELIGIMPQGYCDIILLTSMPLAHVEKEMDDKRIVKIFTKPFNVQELTETIIDLNNAG
jgi:DNA-binding NtrC family response regulator